MAAGTTGARRKTAGSATELHDELRANGFRVAPGVVGENIHKLGGPRLTKIRARPIRQCEWHRSGGQFTRLRLPYSPLVVSLTVTAFEPRLRQYQP
jgi:hypothetical protein